jgi:hypothetical protein
MAIGEDVAGTLGPIREQGSAAIRQSASLDQVIAELERIRAAHPVLAQDGAYAAAFVATAEYPHDAPAKVARRAAMMLWAVSFDDLLDRPQDGAIRTYEVLAECLDLAVQEETDTPCSTEHGRLLLDFKCELETHKLWRAVRPTWSDFLIRFISGSLYEYAISDRRLDEPDAPQPPTLMRYLARARHSIALPWLLISDLVQTDDDSARPHIPALARLAEACGDAMRLANDLATFHREDREGVANAVRLLAMRNRSDLDPESSEQSLVSNARRKVQRRLRLQIAELDRLAISIATASAVERRFLAVTQLGISLYAQGDVRDWRG